MSNFSGDTEDQMGGEIELKLGASDSKSIELKNSPPKTLKFSVTCHAQGTLTFL